MTRALRKPVPATFVGTQTFWMWILLVGGKNRGGYGMTTSDTACVPANGLLVSLRSKRIGHWAVLAVLTVFALANPRLTAAQAVYGSVFGTVTDSTGAFATAAG